MADTKQDWGKSSRLYEVNIGTWSRRYGRGSPQMLSIAEAERISSKRVSETRIRAAEMKKLRSEEARSGAACRCAVAAAQKEQTVYYINV